MEKIYSWLTVFEFLIHGQADPSMDFGPAVISNTLWYGTW